ncbi:MAG: hypothetical protein K6G84_14440 [Lachnospiraceae bacterium]|nr:hypothetical protein [Lachnospiraceae bacterium]
MKTLKAASISEDNYFNNLIGNDVVKIAKDIRDTHSKDAETGEATTPVYDILDSFEELKRKNKPIDSAIFRAMGLYRCFKIELI